MRPAPASDRGIPVKKPSPSGPCTHTLTALPWSDNRMTATRTHSRTVASRYESKVRSVSGSVTLTHRRVRPAAKAAHTPSAASS